MSTITTDELIKNVRDLPSLPVIVIELLNSFNRQDASTMDLASKVSHDQSLSAKTLRLANSSFYGLSRKITTIQQAITVLGFDSVRTLVTAAAVTGTFSASSHATFNFKAYWQHAIGTALCSKKLAQALNFNQDSAFISGLLHDIGKLVLVTRFPQEYSEAIAYRASHDCYMLEAERAVLKLDHTVVGLALAEYWKFPELMQQAIAHHHAPVTQDLGDIPCVVHVADAIVHALDLCREVDPLVPIIVENAWNRLPIAPAILQRIFREIETEFEEACQVLAV
jgi:putative nucleotidyltransferase with HDIG domain